MNKYLRRKMYFSAALVSVILTPGQVIASPIAALSSGMLILLQASGPQNRCFTYTYDVNGNLTLRSDLNFSSPALWGSSVYGCAAWTAAS